ncbi:MAG: sulfite exporter TauE/SafE family protein [Pirellulales bacterium]|nr:sulfite exporter TauE/SafE family protein [Pirellulales bacterium]
MIELPLIFVGGLLGSAHCIGMCGPLALTLGAGARGAKDNLRRQVVFSAGRLFTYAAAGAAAGFGGLWLAQNNRTVVLSQAWVGIVAGAALVLIGLATAGILPRKALKLLGGVPCGAAAGLKSFLTAPHLSGVLLAGVFTGFIPCGLVYAFLLKALSTGSVLAGGLTMLAFGLGTMPLMIAAGAGASLLSIATRQRVFHAAAWCVVLTGAITIARGATQLSPPDGATTAPCPLCEAADGE